MNCWVTIPPAAIAVLLAGCSIMASDNLRFDIGCTVIRNPQTGKIEHFGHCNGKLPLRFEWRFDLEEP